MGETDTETYPWSGVTKVVRGMEVSGCAGENQQRGSWLSQALLMKGTRNSGLWDRGKDTEV